ncbi:MAG: galactose oxidase-like domain-containing protein [Acidimicrobiales bacterium]
MKSHANLVGVGPATASVRGVSVKTLLAILVCLCVTAASTLMGSDNRADAETATVLSPQVGGKWSEHAPWGFIPLHAALAPDGKLLTYGLYPGGTIYGDNQRVFDTWDPTAGITGGHAYKLDETGSSLYCSITVSDPGSDGLMILGGTSTADGQPPNNNFGLRYRDADIIKLGPAEQMVKPRWYPSALTLWDGRILVQGGTDNLTPDQRGTPVITPEIYKPGEPWRLLTGATSQKIYGIDESDPFSPDAYNYPRSWVTPNGRIFGVTGKHRYYIDPDGNGGAGSIDETLGEFPMTNGRQVIGSSSAAVRFSATKVLQVGGNGGKRAVVIDLSPPVATVTPTADMAHARVNGDATVLPDGSVLVNGGSADRVDLGDVAYVPEIWTPENGGTWKELNANWIPRLYHSAAVLLRDGSVWVGGGGEDGPADPDDLNGDGETAELNNRNAQIFQPPYLFTDDGEPVSRYSIAGAPTVIAIDGSFDVTITPRDDGTVPTIREVRLLRNGNSTHSTNSQTAEELPFTSLGNGRLRITSPKNKHLAPPGDYHLFAVDSDGVPSIGAPVKIEIPVIEPPDGTVPDEPVRVRSVSQPDSGYLTRAAELRGDQWKPSINASLEQLTDPTWRSRQWDFEPAGDGLYRIRSRWSELGDNPRPYLTRTARRVGETWVPADGVRLENYQADWGSQKWQLTASNEGGFTITNNWSPASGVLTRSGAALSVGPPSGSELQRWTITSL